MIGRTVTRSVFALVVLALLGALPRVSRAEPAGEIEPLLQKIQKRYEDAERYEADITLSQIDSQGQMIPETEKQSLHLKYRDHEMFRFGEESWEMVSDGTDVRMNAFEEKMSFTFKAPDELGILEMSSANGIAANYLKPIPVIDLLAKGVKDLEITSVDEAESDGKGVHVLELDTRFRDQLYVDPETGTVLQSRFALDPEGQVWLRTDYDNQKFNEAAESFEVSLKLPEDFQDVTKQVVQENPHADMIDKPAPDFSLETYGGETVTLSSLKGNAVVLDFWATWCPPCREGLPKLQQLSEEMKDQKVKFLAMNMDEGPDAKEQIDKFAERYGITIPQVKATGSKAAINYRVQGIPQTVVIGPDGKVENVYVGYSDGMATLVKRDIERSLQEATAETSSAD